MLGTIASYIKQAQQYTKFIVAIVGGLLTVAAAFIPVEWSPVIQSVLAALTAFSVYAFPNVTPEGDIEYPEPPQV